MTCREAVPLLPLFFDGELEPRQMRAVALHSTRCATCEGELRQMEHLQEVVTEVVHARVDEIDFAKFWAGVEQRLDTGRIPWWQRARAWWSEGNTEWNLRLPALAAAAALAVLALLMFARAPRSTVRPETPQVATADNTASIDSLDSGYQSVTVMNDPETHTTVLWVSDETSGEAP